MKRVTQFVMSLVFGGIVLYSLLWHFNLQQTMASVPRWTPQNRPYVDGAKPAIGDSAQARVL
jgi:hypothetical protein